MVAPGQVQSCRVWKRCIQEDRCTLWSMAAESTKQRLYNILIIGKKRPDFIAKITFSEETVASQLAIIHSGKGNSSGLLNP
jgi:hypothetical protein